MVFSRSSADLSSAIHDNAGGLRLGAASTALVHQDDTVDLGVKVDRVGGRGAAAGSAVADDVSGLRGKGG